MREPEKFWRAQARIGFIGIVTAGGAVACAATVIGFFGLLGWLPELFSHFRLQYGGGLLGLMIVMGVFRRWKTAAVFAGFAILNAALIAPLYFGRPTPPPANAPRLKFLLMNVRTENRNYEAVRQLVRTENADVVAIEEVNGVWLNELAELNAAYPHRVLHARSDNFGIALYSRVPWSDDKILPDLGAAGVESISARLSLGNGTVQLLFTHPLPPGSPDNTRWRNGQLADIAAWAKRQPPPVMVLGDLNTTPWSPYFTKLLRDSGLRDSAKGFGVQPTWPAMMPILLIPIDHALLGPGLVATERRVGPDVGSDHYPLIITVAADPAKR